jgi:hypothetical protein
MNRRVLALVAAASLATPAFAMQMKVLDDQLIMSGTVDGSELARLRDVEATPQAGRIKTVVLRDSPGGDHWTALRAGEFIRSRGWATAVSGHCFSACSLIYLGGRERGFTDDKPALQTQLAFHATYFITDSLTQARGAQNPYTTYSVRTWMKQQTDGRISDAVLDRLERLPQTDFLHFFDAARMPRPGQPSAFVCALGVDGKRKCDAVAGIDVYSEGISTTRALVRPNDYGMENAPAPK